MPPPANPPLALSQIECEDLADVESKLLLVRAEQTGEESDEGAVSWVWETDVAAPYRLAVRRKQLCQTSPMSRVFSTLNDEMNLSECWRFGMTQSEPTRCGEKGTFSKMVRFLGYEA